MAFVLTPRFAPAYQSSQCSPFGFCAPATRPGCTYRVSRPQPRRPQYSSFNHFFGQVDELLSEIDREARRQAQIEAHIEAQREAYRQRQQRKRALRAQFTVHQTEQGWQVDGDIRGFDQENIHIEIIDENTLKISGNTQWQAEKTPQSDKMTAAETPEQETQEPHALASPDNMDGVALNEPEAESASVAEETTIAAATPDSDTESHKSYQPTVEDDFEDLGAEASSLFSASPGTSTPAEPKEPKGKEKAVEKPVTTETLVASQSEPEVPGQQEQQNTEKQESVHGSFERTFRFPERIQAEIVSASFEAGSLKITVPRAQAPAVRRIAIM